MCRFDHRPQAGSHREARPPTIAILKTGRTYPKLARQRGDFEDWMIRGLGVVASAVAIVDVEDGLHLPDPADISAAVVTGSHAMVTEGQDWVEPLAEWIRGLVQGDVPVLGVCYGHQLLGHALGGRVGFHPDGPEIGTVEVELLQEAETDHLFRGMPSRFHAHATHAQSVLELPEEAVLLAKTDHEAHAVFRIGACAWGVQFHPEYDEQIMRCYVREQRATLEALGRDPDHVEGEVRRAGAEEILRRFAGFAGQRHQANTPRLP